MTIAALYCVFNDNYWLPYSYQSAYDAVDAIYFFLNKRPWHGDFVQDSRTIECIESLPDPARKITVVPGDWASEIDQRNLSLAYAETKGHSHGLIIDADEVYETSALINAIRHSQAMPELDCWHMRWFTYWKSALYRIDPPEPYDPPVIAKLGSGGFVEARNFLGEKHELMPPDICICHHMSYARPDSYILEKHIAAPGHSQSMHPRWFEDVWKKWDFDKTLENLHPVTPHEFKRAVPQPRELLPTVLRPLYDAGGLP